MFPFVDTTVGTLLTIQAQVDFAALTTDHRPKSSAVDWGPVLSFAGITEGHMARRNPNSVVVPHAFLPMKFQLTAHTLQATTLITLIGGLI